MSTQEQPAPRGRGKGRPFPKGKSGNPAGRKKRSWGDNDITALCREASPDAVKTLITLFRDPAVTPGVRAQCADKVLDRAYGKAPAIQHHISHDAGRMGELTDQQLLRLIAGEPLSSVLAASPVIEAVALPAPAAEAADTTSSEQPSDG